MVRLLMLASLLVSSWASFVCPSNRQIFPCECLGFPQTLVRCDDVFDLATVRNSLQGKFSNSFRLYLTSVHSYTLPANTLGELPIKYFSLKHSNIRHIDADAFEGQKHLQALVLAYDRIEDLPTRALQGLTSLRTLSLVGNFLMKIPEQSPDTWPHLKFLALAWNRISEIERDAFPASLEVVSFSHNHLGTLNGSLLRLGNLTDIYASDNRLTSVRGEFDGLSHLRTLVLDRNHIRDLSGSFSGLESLAELSLSGNRIHDLGKDLAGLERLKFLNLSHNYVTELHWRMFERLRDLQVLDLSGNYLKSVCPALKPLRSLRELGLSDLGMEDLLPDCFRNMKYLSSLDLSRNRLETSESVSRHPLPDLTLLKLNDNRLTTMGHELKYAKRLKVLDIAFNRLESLKWSQFDSNRELATLGMEGNPWECSDSMTETLKVLEERNVSLEGKPEC